MNKTYDHLRLLSLNQAAKFMHIGYDKLQQLISDGLIKIIQIGKRYYIPVSEIERYYADNLTSVKLIDNSMNSSQANEEINFNSQDILNKILGG
ncbi:MAG: helix-turn-helix domain-containing protein [Melioribacteraceae bacterium]|nr:helix-turn-helix domain-containing protein [Melioribacteraceae bacterium]